MTEKTNETIPLNSTKIEILEEMVKSYELPNIGKAVRCLVDFARAHPEQQASIFSEIRCHDC